jgi:hypothetical protein
MRRVWAGLAIGGLVAAVGIAVVAVTQPGSSSHAVSVGLRDRTAAPDPPSTTIDALAGTTTTTTIGGSPIAAPAPNDPSTAVTPSTAAAASPRGTETPPSTTDPPVGICWWKVIGLQLVSSYGCGMVDATIYWYYRCPPDTSLPSTLPGNTVITSCPYLWSTEEVSFDGKSLYDQPPAAWSGSPPGLANCMVAYLHPSFDTYLGDCS